jgi:hypothetical protein
MSDRLSGNKVNAGSSDILAGTESEMVFFSIVSDMVSGIDMDVWKRTANRKPDVSAT